MTRAEILAFMNANPTCFLATVDGDDPHVRCIGIQGADENGILIQTWKIKDIHSQLVKNPKVELCFN